MTSSVAEVRVADEESLEKKLDVEEPLPLARKTNFSIDSLLQRKLGSIPPNAIVHPPPKPKSSRNPQLADSTVAETPTVFRPQQLNLETLLRSPFSPFFNASMLPFQFGPQQHPADIFFPRFPPVFPDRPTTATVTSGQEDKRVQQWETKPPYNPLPTAFNNALGLEGASRTTTTATKTPPVKKYKCDICGKAFSRSNTLVTHKRIHTGEKPFKCDHCGRAFRQPGNLTRHRLTHTTVKPYICSHCGKAFNRASNLHTHMRTHTNYRPFVCPFCGKGFHQKIDMKIHSYTHTGEKPHRCGKCGRGFKQLTHLNYHLRTHSEDKPFNCPQCSKGFNQKGNLQAHVLGHTGERPFKCDICHKGFTLASTLNTHKRTHSEVKPYICHHCGKDFYQKNSLKSHLIASHPYADSQSFL